MDIIDYKRRIRELNREIARLKESVPADQGEATVVWLIDTAETFTKAAQAIIEARSKPEKPAAAS